MTTLEPGCGPLAATLRPLTCRSLPVDVTVPPLAFTPLQLGMVLQLTPSEPVPVPDQVMALPPTMFQLGWGPGAGPLLKVRNVYVLDPLSVVLPSRGTAERFTV